MSARLICKNILQVTNKHASPYLLKRMTQIAPTITARFQTQESHLTGPIEPTTREDDESPVFDPFTRDPGLKKPYLDELAPPIKRSYNLAAYVNSSKCLQELIKLGVSLYDIENVNFKMAQRLITMDFEIDCAPYVRFLVDNGLKEKNLGRFISEFPTIFTVPIEDLQVRIDYLKSKKFTVEQISKALNRSSEILRSNVKSLDFKLGRLQVEFLLPAPLLRTIVSKYPPVISLPADQYKLIYFCITEEFGFDRDQMHKILEQQPEILDMLRPVLIIRLDLLHNQMGLSHEMITLFPNLINGPRVDMKERFLYLKKLKRNQFNPKLPLYVPPSALYNGTDEEFCRNHAKTSLEDYKLFLKSL